MEDETYKTSITKKRMVFLALRNGHSSDPAKAIAGLSRGFKKAFKETKERIVGRTGEEDPNSSSN
jgi:hypothetical protein